MELLLEAYVKEEYLDYNNHMNVIAYYTVFNKASSKFNHLIIFDRAVREQSRITIFTLESHITYLKEITKGENFKIFGRILDYDEKKFHFFAEMRNQDGDLLAACESMYLAVGLDSRKAEHFPEKVFDSIRDFYEKTKDEPWPLQVGRKIRIRRKD